MTPQKTPDSPARYKAAKILPLAVFFLFVMVLPGFAGYLSVIKMKDGQVYKCRIVDLDDGVYTVDINGQQQKINRADVLETGWEKDGKTEAPQEKKASGPAPQKANKGVYFILEPAADYMFFISQEESAVFGSGMPMYGINAAMDYSGEGWSSIYGLMFRTGFASGELLYSGNYYTSITGTSAMNTTRYLFQLYYENIFGPKKNDKLFFSIMGGVGLGFNRDVIDSYPAEYGWGNERLDNSYITLLASVRAEILFYINKNWIITASGGYQHMSGNTYADTGWIYDYFMMFDAIFKAKSLGGPVIGVSMKIAF